MGFSPRKSDHLDGAEQFDVGAIVLDGGDGFLDCMHGCHHRLSSVVIWSVALLSAALTEAISTSVSVGSSCSLVCAQAGPATGSCVGLLEQIHDRFVFVVGDDLGLDR